MSSQSEAHQNVESDRAQSSLEQDAIKLSANESILYDGKHYDRIYDQFHPDVGYQDIDFLIDLATRSGDPILELCCGTGRLTIPLAEKGFQITGIDLSDSMLEEAKRRSSKVEWLQGDICNFNLGKKFSLIIFPTNCIWHLTDLESLEACFACVKKHLKPDGLFLIDTFNISNKEALPQLLSTNRQLLSIYDDPDGKGNVVVTFANEFDFVNQINNFKLYFRLPGAKEDRVEETKFRCYLPQELEILLKYNGFTVENKYGDYDRSPITSTSNQNLLICRLSN